MTSSLQQKKQKAGGITRQMVFENFISSHNYNES